MGRYCIFQLCMSIYRSFVSFSGNILTILNDTPQTDPRNSLASPQRGHANDIFHYVQLPLPPEIPPTKLKGEALTVYWTLLFF